MTGWPAESNFHSSNQSENLVFGKTGLPMIFWFFMCAIFLLTTLFSSNPYLKFSGIAGVLSIFFYLFFFRFLNMEKRFEKLRQESFNRSSFLERLEETTLHFMDGKNKEKFASFLVDFFSQLLDTQAFLLFLRVENAYRLFDLTNKNIGFKKRAIKIDEPFVLCLKRRSDLLIFDLIKEEEADAGHNIPLPSGLKGIELKSALPLKAEDELVGFVLFTSDKIKSAESKFSLSEEKQRLTHLVARKLFWLEEIRGLKTKFQKKSKEYLDRFGQEKITATSGELEAKRKIFDLHSLFQSANQIYLSLDQNRLFFNFTQTLQRQLSAKSVLIFLPEQEGKSLKARYSKGVDFLQFSEIGLEKGDPLYGKLRGDQTPSYLYQLMEEYQENELLTRTISQGFQVCFPLNLLDNQLGLVFLGGRTEGVKYKEEDFLILSFLNNILNVSLKNVTQYKKLEELSYTDSLSGLYNYRYFCKRLNEEILRAKRYQRKLALVIFDIDEFKIYNDSFGHQSGDQIIKQLGELILKVVRSIDVVCRYGGDEFCVIMPETDQEECSKFIERLRKHIQHHSFKNEFLQLEHHLTVSAGAAIYPQHARTSEKLIYCADMALLKAKNSGKNKVTMYNGEEISSKSPVPL